MRILVFGAGVLGSLYAARLHDADHDVTILARGERLSAIREHGIVIRDEGTGLLTTSLVPAIDHLDSGDHFDLVMVFVRHDQTTGVLASLAESQATPNVIFMGNNAAGPAELVKALGRERVLLGFPGAGGTIIDDVVHARLATGWALPTTIGELDGSTSKRIREIEAVLRSAGFPVSVSGCIDAWLKTHAAIVVPLAGAIYGAAGDMGRLVGTPDLLILTVRAIRENLAGLRAGGVRVSPWGYQRLFALPDSALIGFLARRLDTEAARLMLARHALTARAEMAMLAAELREMATTAGVETPSLDRLATYADPAVEPMEEASRTLVVHHPLRAAAIGGGTALAGLGIGLLVLRRVRPELLVPLPIPRFTALHLPTVRLTTVRLTTVHLPTVRLPTVHLPTVRLPTVHLPMAHVAVLTISPGLAASIGRLGPNLRRRRRFGGLGIPLRVNPSVTYRRSGREFAWWPARGRGLVFARWLAHRRRGQSFIRWPARARTPRVRRPPVRLMVF